MQRHVGGVDLCFTLSLREKGHPRREGREECVCLALCRVLMPLVNAMYSCPVSQSVHVAPSHLSNRAQACRVAEHQM